MTIDIRRNPDDTIDEVVAQAASIHIEDMGENGWHILIQKSDRWCQFSICDGSGSSLEKNDA